MRKLLYIILIFFNVFVFAQKDSNPFADTEEQNNTFNESAHNEQREGNEDVASKGPGNPGDPVPIDGYLPVLLLAAGGMIVYYTRKRNKIAS